MKIFIVFLLVFYSCFVFSQQEINNEQKDLKVGLVLSGGGAKGFAHIAVLKVLEEANVRVDYISGTSMGAIIGAMYASGYSAKQIDLLIRNVDFNELILDEIPRKSKPFHEKEKGEKYALILPVKNGRVSLPLALSSGQNILNLLTDGLSHVDTISDFSKLPIPFVCVATDLETGEKVVLKDGFLPLAIQASGAFPTLLAPVEIDGRLLVDGGIMNNFPVDEVQKMNPDIIIGVELGNKFSNREGLNSGISIINQILSFQIYDNYDEQRANTDVLIHPDMTNYKVTSFSDYDAIYKLGEVSARNQFDALVAIGEQQSKKKIHAPISPQPKKIFIHKININGNEDYTDSYVKSKMQIGVGQAITLQHFSEGLNNLTATGNFSSIQYRIEETGDGSVINLKLKQNTVKASVKLALHYDDLYKAAMLVNYTVKHLIIKNDIVSADLILGDNIRYNFDYFIDNESNWSIGLKSRYNTFKKDMAFDWVDSDINKIDLKYLDFTNTLYFQNVLNRKLALRIGVEHKNIRAYTETFIPITLKNDRYKYYFDRSNYLNFISCLKLDTYDKKYLPKSGVNFDVEFRWYLVSSDYNENFKSFSQLTGELAYAHSFFNNKFTAHIISEAGINIGENNVDVLNYHLGGYGENYINTFIPFYGYDFGKLSGEGYLLTALKLRHEIFRKNYLMATAAAARVGRDFFNSGNIFEDSKTGYGFGYGVDSFLGPIELNYTYSPDIKKNFWYFNLGYWF